ncbi:unnamed protein product [Miscanthus lutarioriparius]|uniref:ATPase AAA-type core domain-containing protein n=1 Tax=Miscanthus lutarioriparius TaxID=422564 RepID=A0A811NSF5_9POAL|nr:unnamed protein product [Miscanthus lutarioriparius]
MVAAVSVPSQAQAVLRGRLCDPAFVHSALRSSPDTNYSKLKYLVSSSVFEACNNSILLLGPRGCGKAAVVDMVLDDLKKEHPDAISVVWVQCSILFSSSITRNRKLPGSFDWSISYHFQKWECGLAHKTILFVLEEFDLFAQGKQRLLYSLLDAMQSLTSQAVVIGVSCRLDADQLLEKRVRSRFSHRKLLFISPSLDDIQRFRAVSYMDMESGFLPIESFLKALSSMQRQPKMDSLQAYPILSCFPLICAVRDSSSSCAATLSACVPLHLSTHPAFSSLLPWIGEIVPPTAALVASIIILLCLSATTINIKTHLPITTELHPPNYRARRELFTTLLGKFVAVTTSMVRQGATVTPVWATTVSLVRSSSTGPSPADEQGDGAAHKRPHHPGGDQARFETSRRGPLR